MSLAQSDRVSGNQLGRTCVIGQFCMTSQFGAIRDRSVLCDVTLGRP